jgi:hypothetical protein
METPGRIACVWCGRPNFWNQKALLAHLNNTICGRCEKDHRHVQHTGPFPLATTEPMDDGMMVMSC